MGRASPANPSIRRERKAKRGCDHWRRDALPADRRKHNRELFVADLFPDATFTN